MALSAPPQDPAVLILGVEDMTQTMPVLEAFQNRLSLTAFEFFSEQALQHVIAEKSCQAFRDGLEFLCPD